MTTETVNTKKRYIPIKELIHDFENRCECKYPLFFDTDHINKNTRRCIVCNRAEFKPIVQDGSVSIITDRRIK